MFARLTVGTKDPLFPNSRRHTSLDKCTPPPPPSHTHTDTRPSEVGSFRIRVSEGTFNPSANSFTSQDKKN
jgi:hypothetical protein